MTDKISIKNLYTISVTAISLAAAIAVFFGFFGKKDVDTELRIMSFNILAELWGGEPVEGRDEKLNTFLETWLPDVAGLQEVTQSWYDHLEKYIGTTYEFTDPLNEDGETNYSTLIYNKNTVKLLKHGTKIYSQGNDPKLRLVSWGLFKSKKTGEKFIVTSTHWDISKNADMITVQAEEMGLFVKKLQNKYKCPVISVGDYNRKADTDQFKNFVKLSGFIDANTAETVTEQDRDAKSIDHIMASTDVTFKEFVILRDEFSTSISDHKPMYADIVI